MNSKQKYEDSITRSTIVCQRMMRAHLTRKRLLSTKDNMSLQRLNKLLDAYNYFYTVKEEINEDFGDNKKHKKIRNINFPSEISENIVKFYKAKQTGIMGTWNTDVGDIQIHDKRCEVKGFMSDGPSSFGPDEKWDWIYFVDCKDFLNKYFQIYEIKLSNNSEGWKQLKVNKTQTFYDQCVEKRRPRLTFKEIQSQLPEECKLIFSGPISALF
jgi:hypothetical protein